MKSVSFILNGCTDMIHKLEVDGKPVGECLCMDAHMFISTDAWTTQNMMPTSSPICKIGRGIKIYNFGDTLFISTLDIPW